MSGYLHLVRAILKISPKQHVLLFFLSSYSKKINKNCFRQTFLWLISQKIKRFYSSLELQLGTSYVTFRDTQEDNMVVLKIRVFYVSLLCVYARKQTQGYLKDVIWNETSPHWTWLWQHKSNGSIKRWPVGAEKMFLASIFLCTLHMSLLIMEILC